MSEEDPKIILSPRSCTVVSGSMRVEVHIFRTEHSTEWNLELVDEDNNSVVWAEPFESDEEAWQEFEDGVRELGLERLLAPDEPTLH